MKTRYLMRFYFALLLMVTGSAGLMAQADYSHEAWVRFANATVNCASDQLFVDVQVATPEDTSFFSSSWSFRFKFDQTMLDNPDIFSEAVGGTHILTFADGVYSYGVFDINPTAFLAADTVWTTVGTLAFDIISYDPTNPGTCINLDWQEIGPNPGTPIDFPGTTGQIYYSLFNQPNLAITFHGNNFTCIADLCNETPDAFDPSDPLNTSDVYVLDVLPGSSTSVCMATNNVPGDIYTADSISLSSINQSDPSIGTFLVLDNVGPDTCFAYGAVNPGSDTILFSICDQGGLCDEVTYIFNVASPPVAVDDTEVTDEDTPVNIAVLSNDTDPDNNIDPTSITPIIAPSHGTVSVDPVTNEIVYTPEPDFNGSDFFTYSICDLTGLCDTAIVTIDIDPVNDPPLALDDAVSTDEETSTLVAVYANDSDPLDPLGNIDPLTVSILDGPTNGSASVDPASGNIIYTPDLDFNGTDQLSYIICDDGNPLPSLCDTAVVTITVNGENDAPVANDDAASTIIDTPITFSITANDEDPNDPLGEIDPTTITILDGPSNGSLSVDPSSGEVTYTPDPAFFGVDTFHYEVCDDGFPLPPLCDEAEVVITVIGVNMPPVAVDDFSNTDEDTPVMINVPANDSDPDGSIDPTSVVIIDPTNNGTLSVNPVTGMVIYTPDPDFNGMDTFTYQICDIGIPLTPECDTAQVVILIDDFNDPPVLVDDNTSTGEDIPVTVDVLDNDSDVEGPMDPSSVNIVSGPSNGSASVDPLTGEITYTPDTNFAGTDTLTYEACDLGSPTPVLCETALLIIDISSSNDMPVAVDDSAITNEDVPVVINVPANDFDTDAAIDPTTVTILTGPSNGSLSVDPVSGEVTYTPNPDYNGTDLFTYEICDTGSPLPSLCDEAEVTITINPVNDPPVANNDVSETDEDTPVTSTVIFNDDDSDGDIDPSTLTILSGPNHGTASVNLLTGQITYTPEADYTGQDTIFYEICDDGTPLPSECDDAFWAITIDPVNDAPIAVDDSATTPEDNPVLIGVIANDSDPDGPVNPASVAIIDAPDNGTASVNPGTGAITYLPNPDYNGADQLTYIICDGSGLCDTADVLITITPQNDPPIAVDDVATTLMDEPVMVDVMANDQDVDGDVIPNTITITEAPSNGSASVDPLTGMVMYVPNPGFTGDDVLTYEVCDDGTPLPALCDEAQLFISVSDLNDPPVAVNDTFYLTEDVAALLAILTNDFDPDGVLVPSSVVVIDNPDHGAFLVDPSNGNVIYSPNPGYSGIDEFTYVVCDNGMPSPSLCDTATVYLEINAINDPPIAINDVISANEDNPVLIPVTDNDADTDGNIDPTTVTIVSDPANGSVSVDPLSGDISYTPDPDFYGTDVFTYNVCDDGTPLPAKCDDAQVTILVAPENDPPLAVDDFESTPENTPVDVDVAANDSDPLDPEGNIVPSTVTILSGPANGSVSVDPVTGIVTYTPNPGFTGDDEFNYEICDDGTPLPEMCAEATVFINVSGVNDAPIANDDSATTEEDIAVNIEVISNDTDTDGNIDPASVTILSDPSNGTVSVNPITGDILYTPSPGFSGVDEFSYNVCDDGTPLPALCDDALVTVTVTEVNDPPIANDDSSDTDEDMSVLVDVTNNDTDSDGNIDPTTVTIISEPSNGTVSIDPLSGDILYTPEPGFNGVDVFTYQVCDDGTPLPAECDDAVVTINIPPLNDGPQANDDNNSTPEDTPVTTNVIDNDTDTDGNIDPSTLVITSGPSNGTASVNTLTGEITYTPDANYNGPDQISYTVCDDGTPLPAQCDDAILFIDVIPVNDPPLALDDNAGAPEDTPILIDVASNDTDPLDPAGNIDPSTVTIIEGPDNGSASVDPLTGEITYTPDPDYNGPDMITYVICDDGNPLPAECDTAIVFIELEAQNDPPVALDDAASTDPETPVMLNPLSNDTDVDGSVDPSTLTIIDGPSNGSVSVDPVNGEIIYTPGPGFSGEDEMTYVVCDDGSPLPSLCDTALITITINGANTPPNAVMDVVLTDEDMALDIDVTANDTDDGDPGNIDPASVVITTLPANGSVSVNPVSGVVTYTPDENFNGSDFFNYSVCDDGFPLPVLCDETVVIIGINPVNDPPVAIEDYAETEEDSPVVINIPANDSDPLDADGNIDPTTVEVTEGPFNGTVLVHPVNGQLQYTPGPGFSGMDSIHYTICDDGNPLPALCTDAWVYITIEAVNDPPIAEDDAASTEEDSPVTIDIAANDSDPNDDLGNIDPATVTILGGPDNGTVSIDPVTGEATYTPNPDFNGTDVFTYSICDDGDPLPAQCDEATVTIEVTPVNDPPIAEDDIADAAFETPVAISVTDNDDDLNDPLGNIDPTTVTIIDGPFNGTAVVDPLTGVITYTPGAGFTGSDSLLYTVCDDGNPLPSLCDTALVIINTSESSNTAPVANTDVYSTNQDTPLTFDPSENDSDVEETLDGCDITILDGPTNGTLVFDAVSCTYTYTPDPGFTGSDLIVYNICDSEGLCDESEVIIEVLPLTNTEPVAADDAIELDEDTSLSFDPAANDTDPDQTLTGCDISILEGPANGALTFDAISCEFNYAPNANYNGPDEVTYVICDLEGACDTAIVAITVNPVNDPPVAEDNFSTTPFEMPVAILVLNNDDDPNDPLGNIDPATVTVIDGPDNGTVSISPFGMIAYTPGMGFTGTDTFFYVVCDDGNPLPPLCDTAMVVITVLGPANTMPTAIDDEYSTLEDTALSLDPSINDEDAEETLNGCDITILDGPVNGTLVFDPLTCTYIYTPDENFNGTDEILYTICDSEGLCDDATITITVDPVNDAPLAEDDSASTPESTPVIVDVLSNDNDDADPDGGIDETSVTILDDPLFGTATVDPLTGEITYTPNDGFSGADSLTYIVCDLGSPLPSQCDTATVYITVEEMMTAIIAVDDMIITLEELPVAFDPAENDISSPLEALTACDVTILSGPSNGILTFDPLCSYVYQPDADFNGTDEVEYVICNSFGDCDTATIFITVEPVNDPPLAVDDLATTDEGVAVDIEVLINDNDDADPMGGIDTTSITLLDPPSNGTATADPLTGIFTYTPDPGFTGTDTFTYIICDTGFPLPSLCDTAEVIITIENVATEPIANDDSYTNPEDVPFSFDPAANDMDEDELLDGCDVSIAEGPDNGELIFDAITCTFTYTPDENYNGEDLITYIICNSSGLCDTAEITINIEDVNDSPFAADDYAETDEETPVIISVSDNDGDYEPDGFIDPATVTIVEGPANGTVTVDLGGEVTYTPDPGFNGTDTFIYSICDDDGSCVTAMVTVLVNPVNDPPVAVDDLATTETGIPVVISIIDNDSDSDGMLNPGSIEITDGPDNGTVVVNTVTGSIFYTPDPGFSGTDTLTYVICDDGSPELCDEALVIIIVNGSGIVPPIAVDDPLIANEDEPLVFNPLDNDIPGDNPIDSTTLSIFDGPENGTVSVDPLTGEVIYTPDPDFCGDDNFSYMICDDSGNCSVANIFITVNCVNDAPVAINDIVFTTEDIPLSIAVTNNDSDPDSVLDPCDITILTAPAFGTAVIGSPDACEVIYTPGPDFGGLDEFTYEVCDSEGLCDTATVFIGIASENDPPVAQDDLSSTGVDTPVSIFPLSNDMDLDGSLVNDSFTVLAGPFNGSVIYNPITGELIYTPDPGFTGTDYIQYTICDDGTPVLCDEALITIDVGDGLPPQAIDDLASTTEDTPVLIPVSDNDLEGDAPLNSASIDILVEPSNGTVTVDPVSGDILYTPNPNFSGDDVFVYVICDEAGYCDEAIVFIVVEPVDDPPVASDDFAETDEDTPVTLNISTNDSDPDGDIDTETILVIDGPDNGDVEVDTETGEVTYTPDPDFNGTDTFTYVICDGTMLCDTADVIIIVNGVLDELMVNDDTAETDPGMEVSVNVLDNDVAGDFPIDITTLVILDGPNNGTASLDPLTGVITYLPDDGYCGADTITYQVCDEDGNCGTAFFIVDVICDGPVAVDDIAATDAETPVLIDILSNDIEGETPLDPTTAAVLSGPVNGTVSIDPSTGEATYLPNAGFCGLDSFAYNICDAAGLCDTAIVLIDVICEGPLAVDDSADANGENPVTVDVLANDLPGSAPIDPTTVIIIAGPDGGDADVDPLTGEITYTALPGFCGLDSLIYEVCDTNGLCATATVFINVNCNGPDAMDDFASTTLNTPVSIPVLDNDLAGDAPLVPSSVSIVDAPDNGTVFVDPVNGVIMWQPDPGYCGNDTFSYEICDTSGICDIAFVFIEMDCADVFIIPEVFTPNGDGYNDRFEIPTIQDFPNNDLMVFNRWENMVYHQPRYLNEWDGSWQEKGKALPDGTYYYILKLDADDPEAPVFTGFVTIHR